MSKLYSCIISAEPREVLVPLAGKFAHVIEVIDEGILFDVSGLERLIGKPEQIAAKILGELQRQNIAGSVAVADTADAAMLLARQNGDFSRTVHDTGMFSQLPLSGLGLERDTLNVFNDLGMKKVEDLLAIPRDELIERFGRGFDSVIKRIEQRAGRLLTSNIAENTVSWEFGLDQAVEDFEQLIFILNHGINDLFGRVAKLAMSTEQLDITFQLANKRTCFYEIKASFPTLNGSFWLKLINLRVSLNAPEAAISSVKAEAHLTRPRPDQRGLYAVSRPEPEKLLLTANKLKRLVGEGNVGTPVLLNERLEQPFRLDAEMLPAGKEYASADIRRPAIAFSYFRPPHRAEVLVRVRRIAFVRSREITGRVTECSGVWRADSKWWGRGWRTQEWDVEIEGRGVYRLSKTKSDWFLVGEYD